jgi:hypothetical protein
MVRVGLCRGTRNLSGSTLPSDEPGLTHVRAGVDVGVMFGAATACDLRCMPRGDGRFSRLALALV